jgi:hypothetical protein
MRELEIIVKTYRELISKIGDKGIPVDIGLNRLSERFKTTHLTPGLRLKSKKLFLLSTKETLTRHYQPCKKMCGGQKLGKVGT